MIASETKQSSAGIEGPAAGRPHLLILCRAVREIVSLRAMIWGERFPHANERIPGASIIGHDGYLATGFRDVDNNSDIGKLEACLRYLDALPSFNAYKEICLARLRLKPGDKVVDLGCGLGFDVMKLADRVSPGGLAIGIDNSEKLLNAAGTAFGHREGVSFEYGDIQDLKLTSDSVDAIRVDRTLQHVQEPQKVISEMARVLKPGGWMVCSEPDWSTFVIDADDSEVTDEIVQTWTASFRNPQMGRQLLRRIRSEELENTWADGLILLADGIDAANIVYDIHATAEKVRARNEEKSRAVDTWLDLLRKRDEHAGVLACVTIFMAGGQKTA